MRKLAVLTVAGVVGLGGVAQAEKPVHPAHPFKSCEARTVGYNAQGTLVQATLAPAAGHHRYTGTMTVDVKEANHRSMTGVQTFTLTDARVSFHHGVSSTVPVPGSRVGLHGKVTELRKGCSTTGFSPTITVRRVDIRQADADKR